MWAIRDERKVMIPVDVVTADDLDQIVSSFSFSFTNKVQQHARGAMFYSTSRDLIFTMEFLIQINFIDTYNIEDPKCWLTIVLFKIKSMNRMKLKKKIELKDKVMDDKGGLNRSL